MGGARRILALVCAATGLLAGCVTVDPYEVAVERGQVALSLGQSEDAADAYRSALVYRPHDSQALLGLARCYTSRGDGESALEMLFNIKGHDDAYFRQYALADYHYALYQAGRERLRRDDPTAALRYLRRLQSEAPSHAGLDDLLVRTLIAEGGRMRVAGRQDEARALFLEARGRDSGGASSALALAEVLIENGEIDTAITLISDAQTHNPDDTRLQQLMDRALRIRYPNPIHIE